MSIQTATNATRAPAGPVAEHRFLGIRAAAERVGLSRRTVRRWVAEGRLASFQPTPKGRVLVELDELDGLVLRSVREPVR